MRSLNGKIIVKNQQKEKSEKRKRQNVKTDKGGKKFFRAIIYMPNIVSAVALATMWLQYVFSPRYGLLKDFFTELHLDNLAKIQFLDNDHKFWALLFAYCFGMVAYHMLIWLSGIERISPEYYEAAAIDGCPPMRTFWKIMFPMAQSGIVTVTIFNFINIWNEYFLSLIFASSDKLKPVAPGLYGMINSMKYTGDWAGMFAAVIIVFLPTFVLYIFLSEKIIGGVTGGIKG